MVNRDSFTAALDALEDSSYPVGDFSQPFVEVLPVSGAAVSTLGDVLGSETLSASDARAAYLDELQFDLGEGPCWDACRLALPIMEPELGATKRWPAFVAAARPQSVRSIFAFPLAVGTLRLGAVDLYSLEPLVLDSRQTQQAAAMAEVIGRRVLRDAMDGSEQQTARVNPHSRRVIHQATGVVLAQLGISPDDAELMIQGHAFATNRSMMDVAQDITGGRLRFIRKDNRIEVIP